MAKLSAKTSRIIKLIHGFQSSKCNRRRNLETLDHYKHTTSTQQNIV